MYICVCYQDVDVEPNRCRVNPVISPPEPLDPFNMKQYHFQKDKYHYRIIINTALFCQRLHSHAGEQEGGLVAK